MYLAAVMKRIFLILIFLVLGPGPLWGFFSAREVIHLAADGSGKGEVHYFIQTGDLAEWRSAEPGWQEEALIPLNEASARMRCGGAGAKLESYNETPCPREGAASEGGRPLSWPKLLSLIHSIGLKA